MKTEEPEITNAIIDKVSLGTGDRGFLDCWIHLDYGGTHQGFGGYVLHLPASFDNHKLESIAGHHICRILEIAGVTEWDRLKGRTIRVKRTWEKISAIGHIVKDDWFEPSKDYKDLK